MAMTGAPAARGAVASAGGAGRLRFGAASALTATSPAAAARKIALAGPRNRFRTGDIAAVFRIAIPYPCKRLRQSAVKHCWINSESCKATTADSGLQTNKQRLEKARDVTGFLQMPA
ncbi:MAG: hypothetical protein EOP21_09505 [Hyphomicrobiales bacterium]|jgi:hypothetical protein|nr:MAG: hypothetical protein EOP21_09505 [Hyphomicrobiales bacterium]